MKVDVIEYIVSVEPDVTINLELSLEELEVIVAGFGLTDSHNRQHRYAAELQKREGIVGAVLALDADQQRKLYTQLAKIARAVRHQ